MIYTTGYAGRRLADLVTIAEQLDALVCDIRYSPVSRMPEWNCASMFRVLRSRYYHLRDWGNINAKTDKPVVLVEDARGLLRVVQFTRKYPNVILICGCGEYSKCHRAVCADLLRNHRDFRTGERFQVEELAWPVPAAPVGRAKALSLHQPWASLMMWRDEQGRPFKQIETRGWPLSYRGPLVIHATKSSEFLELCNQPPFCDVLSARGIQSVALLPRGAALGVVDVVDCQPTEFINCEEFGPYERAFGDYSRGRYGFITTSARMFATPIEARGNQGVWNCDVDLENCCFATSEAHQNAPAAEREPSLF